ncbi:MAG: YjbQ family protein, partial [Candidatus Neomarinimicrobiota bacterium]
MREITISSSRRVEFIDITSKVRKIVEEEEVREGICLIYCPHTTAGLTINENADPDVVEDIKSTLGKLIPSGAGYSH